MTRRNPLNALGLIVAAASLAIGSPSAHAQGTPAFKIDRPALKVGEQWTFNHIDLWKNEVTGAFRVKVTAVTKNSVTLRSKNLKKPNEAPYIFVETPDLNTVSNSTGRVWSPYFPVFMFPLVPGKTWDRKSTMKRTGGHFKYDTKGTVQGVEQVTVPAGTFQAVKVTLFTEYDADTSRGQGSGTMSETIWYAPKVDYFVKKHYHDTSWSGSLYNRYKDELVSYKLQ